MALMNFYMSPTAQALTLLDEPHINSAPTPELARLNGYRCDIHTVTTEDQYVLHIHRFPGGRTTALNCSLPPVLLIHGLLLDSACWLIPGPSQGLVYLLAEQGYDVWLENLRGNNYGRYNIRYNVDENPFWDFSWEKAGLNDVSAIIDYVLATTGHEQLLMVGHSMGSTEIFSLLTVKPEYNAKVQHVVALGPVAYLSYSTSLIVAIAPFGEFLRPVVDFLTHGELVPRNMGFDNFLKMMCALEVNAAFCEDILFLLFGFDPVGFDETLLPSFYGHFPSGASYDTLLHFFQVINSKRFQRFDYGAETNLEIYGSTTPPEFDLSQITVSMSFFYGDGDTVTDRKDLMTLLSKLKNQVDVYRVNQSSINHIDYLFVKNVKTLVNDKVISIFQEKQTLSSKTSCKVLQDPS